MCTNALYFQHMGVCLTSLLTNNPSLFFDIVVVRRTGEELDEDKLRRTLARFLNYSLSFRVFTFPADPLLPLNPDAHYTLDNWTRLWIENFFPDDIDRVLYLDSDILVVGSVAALWCADLDGDGNDELIIGVRDNLADKPGQRRGVRIYKAVDDAGTKWARQIIEDGGVAVEDLSVADLNGDGQSDLVAVGRQTHNIRIYWNEGRK